MKSSSRWFPSFCLGTHALQALACRQTGSRSFLDCIPKQELGNEPEGSPDGACGIRVNRATQPRIPLRFMRASAWVLIRSAA